MFKIREFWNQTLFGKAKILGSLVGVVGATILTFLKGMELKFSTSVNLLKLHSNGGHDQKALHYESGDRIMGSILAVASYFSYLIWLIIQAKICKVYPCHYSSTTLMCLVGSVQDVIFVVCVERNKEQ
ncbi:WAT1-related protein [Platanthera guangdongensis]|uniref:WAT1-related protein n=1 Tax=Platanthera guangdongensis TaxID=2320717 RepID=A0ABR2M8P1_9ASPA